MTTLSPPPQDELELLIRGARSRQRKRRLVGAAAVAVVAAAGLSLWAAIPGGGGGGSGTSGGGDATTSRQRRIDNSGRVPIVEVGTSGGVTWAFNGLAMWLTTNGGRTWRASAPRHVRAMGDLMERVEQVEFADPRHGWLFAVDVRGGRGWTRQSELDRTSDGGRTWHATSGGGNVSFLTPRLGYSVAGSQLLATRDGGATWQRVSRVPFNFGVPTFVDSRRGVAVATGNGRLFSTSDEGKRWASARVPRRAGVVANVAAFGERLVVPADLSDQRDPWGLVVYVSDDGGATWQARLAPKSWAPTVRTADPWDFSAASPSVWYAVFDAHKLAVTTDAGRSWRLVKVADWPARWTISTVDFTSPRVGWAVFQLDSPPEQSVLMRTTDGGIHWKPAGPLGHEPRLHHRTVCASSCRRP